MIFHQKPDRVGASCRLVLAVLLLVAPLLATVRESKKVDKVLVFKHDHELRLLNNGKVIKSYKVALGADPVGPKMEQGDHKTPEGTYILDRRNANSRFHRALH